MERGAGADCAAPPRALPPPPPDRPLAQGRPAAWPGRPQNVDFPRTCSRAEPLQAPAELIWGSCRAQAGGRGAEQAQRRIGVPMASPASGDRVQGLRGRVEVGAGPRARNTGPQPTCRHCHHCRVSVSRADWLGQSLRARRGRERWQIVIWCPANNCSMKQRRTRMGVRAGRGSQLPLRPGTGWPRRTTRTTRTTRSTQH